jgi:hypothetical protein
MSEYQYYEWQTIDRPLTAAEQRQVNALSSHMDTVTSTQAVVTYSYGDFKHNPAQVLLKYFDAFLYDSNFGSRSLIFRLPKDLTDAKAIAAYCLEDWITLEEHDQHFLIEVTGENDDGYEWVESDGILGQLTSLREQLLRGDYRMLYIMWLKAMESNQQEMDEEDMGPPVPAGLGGLDAALQALVEFFDVNPHLVAAAVVGSGKKAEPAPEPDLETAIQKLTRAEADYHLLQLARGEPGALLLLKKRLMKVSGRNAMPTSPSKFTVAELLERADQIERQALRRAREEAEKKRIERLELVAQNEEAIWINVETLLNQKRGGAYDEATQLLVELRDLAKLMRRSAQYQERFDPIRAKYAKSAALTERFRRAGLLSTER